MALSIGPTSRGGMVAGKVSSSSTNFVAGGGTTPERRKYRVAARE